MVSANKMQETVRTLLGTAVSNDVDYDVMAERLNAEEAEQGVALTEYGYVMWAVDHFGHKCAYKNVMESKNLMHDYALAAAKMRDDMPTMLVNANTYVTKLMSNVADLATCFRQLEGMTFPHVLYVLFAGSGQPELVTQYRPEMEEIMKRYPDALALLPESFKSVGQEVLDADAEQR